METKKNGNKTNLIMAIVIDSWEEALHLQHLSATPRDLDQ